MNRMKMYCVPGDFRFLRRSRTILLFLNAIVFLLLMAGCGGQERNPSREIVYPPETAQLVSEVTGGIISPGDPLVVRFVSPVIKQNLAGTTLAKQVFTFSPSIDGTAKWEDVRTLVFQPNRKLPMRQDYTGRLDLQKLLPKSGDELQPLEFSFRVAGREIAGFRADFEPAESSRREQVYLQGNMTFTQPAELQELKEAGRLLMDGKQLSLHWEKGGDDHTFTFRGETVRRNDKQHRFEFRLQKSPLELSADFRQEFTLEPLQAFVVRQIRSVETGSEPAVAVDFSDRLQTRQDITGLISVRPAMDIKLKKSGNTVDITGAFEHGKTYTVVIHPGIGSKWGTRTEQESEKQISFEDIKPQMRFMSDGVFLPSGNQQKLLFQTVNLQQVRLKIRKVFESNLGQFLQTEKLSGGRTRSDYLNDYELRRVGIQVADTTLSIGDTRNRWLQHALDLRNLIPQKDKGLYIVSLTFQREDMLYGPEKQEEEVSRRGRYWGEHYYSNPNSPGYIYRHGRIFKPLILSDIGLSYQQGYEQHIIFATDLLSTAPLPGTEIRLRTYQNQLIAARKTDESGKAVFENISGEVFYVEGEKNGQRSVIKLNDMAWNMSGFNVGGAEVPGDGVQAFIYTERGVYRPGDTLHLSLIARNRDNTFPDRHPVRLKIYNPRNQLIYDKTQKDGKDGFYSFEFSTAPEDMTGNWKAEFEIGTQKFYHTLKIETVAPYRLKVTLTPEKTPLGPEDEQLQLELAASYLFGNPGANLAAEVSVDLISQEKKFDRYPGYIFTHQGREFQPVEAVIFNGRLNAAGKAQISWQLPALNKAPSAIQANVTAKVFEKGGRASENRVAVPVDPYPYYVGLESPELKYGFTRVGAPLPVKTVLVNPAGQSVAGQPLRYRIYKNSRYWWWEYRSGEDFHLRFKSDASTVLVEEGTLVSGSTPVPLQFRPEEQGEYLLEVQAPGGSGHTAGLFVRAYHWGEAPSGNQADLLSLNADKDKYFPGETARVSFPTPKEGAVLVSVAKSSRVLKTYRLAPDKQKNETVIQVPVTEEMLPTAYVAVSVIQPHSQTLNDRPIRMYGVVPLLIEDPATRQAIDIELPASLKSGQDFTVDIQTADRRRTRFTIAVVDEGLLALTRFQTPDPWEAFYSKRRLTVKYFDLFSEVIGANKGDIFKTFAIGGGMADEQFRLAQQQPEKVRRFTPVSLFRGPLQTDENGHARVSFHLPDYIGAVRVMVVAADRQRYGSAQKTVPVKTDLMVLPTLPRVLGPGDAVTEPVTVFAMRDEIKNVAVSLTVEGPLKVTGEAEKTLTFDSPGDREVNFRLAAGEAAGTAVIKIRAVSGNLTATDRTGIAVRPSSPRIYRTLEAKCRPGQQVSLRIPGDGLPGTNHAALSVMRKQRLNLTGRLRWLIHYPYGCIEQTVSAVFPQLYLKDFIKDAQNAEQDIDRNINEAIRRLRKFQLPSGAFSYWPGEKEPSVWGTNYAGHFLIEARKLGYHVPADLLDNWLRFQKSRALTTRDNLLEKVYRLYLLALAGEPQPGPLNLLKENSLPDMTDPEKWLLASAYKLAGVENSAGQILKNTGLTVGEYGDFSDTYGSALRDKAIILQALVLFGRQGQAEKLYDDISAHLAGDTWYSTQTTGYALLALGKYIRANAGDFREENPVLAGYLRLPDGEKIPFDTGELRFSRVLSGGWGDSITIFINGKTNLEHAYVTLEWDGIPLKADVREIARKLQLAVEWLDEDGMPLDPSALPQGRTFWGHFTARKAPGQDLTLEEMALVQVLPAGWEIDNTRLSGERLPDWMRKWRLNRAEYTDIRDDRIMWFFDMPKGTNSLDFAVKLTAVTAGEFMLPPAVFEAMYNNDYRAVKPGQPVRVNIRE